MTTITKTQSLPAADSVDVSQLLRFIESDPSVRVLDVRTGAEFQTAHIAGSYNVPLDTLGEHVKDLADVEHPVVLVCQSGARATQAHGKLAAAGKTTLHILDGGMAAWETSGGDVVRGDTQRWAMERQVRFTAGSMSVLAILVSVFVPPIKWIAGGVAAGLTYSAATNTCVMAQVLSKLPYNRTDRCDIAGVLAELNGAQTS